MRPRHGFTLVEILVALVIMGLVTGSLFQLLTNTQRLSRAQTEQVDLQSNVRTGSLVVPAELRELNTVLGGLADQNDILDAQPDLIRYRAGRGLYLVCQPTTAALIQVWETGEASYRAPQAGEGMYLFVENDPDTEKDDSWVHLPIIAAVPTNACPGGAAGYTLTTAGAPIGISGNAPVRVYEEMELSLYISGGESWLGARSVSAGGVVQPILGPLLPTTGFELDYLDASGAETGDNTAVKAIQVTVRGVTDEAVRINGAGAWGHPEDSLVTRVLLRNSVRP